MINSQIIGLDLAKNVIQICKIDSHGELISNKALYLLYCQLFSGFGCINS